MDPPVRVELLRVAVDDEADGRGPGPVGDPQSRLPEQLLPVGRVRQGVDERGEVLIRSDGVRPAEGQLVHAPVVSDPEHQPRRAAVDHDPFPRHGRRT